MGRQVCCTLSEAWVWVRTDRLTSCMPPKLQLNSNDEASLLLIINLILGKYQQKYEADINVVIETKSR